MIMPLYSFFSYLNATDIGVSSIHLVLTKDHCVFFFLCTCSISPHKLKLFEGKILTHVLELYVYVALIGPAGCCGAYSKEISEVQ